MDFHAGMGGWISARIERKDEQGVK